MRMEAGEFERAVREHQGMVFGLTLHALRDRGRAEEITQDVFLALLEQGGRIATPEHLIYWLRRVAARKCIDAIRRQRWRQWLPLREDDAVTAPGSDPLLRARLERLIRALPAAVRLALVLRYGEEMEPEEIGRVLGIAEQEVKKKLRQALAGLRARLGPYEATLPEAWEQPR